MWPLKFKRVEITHCGIVYKESPFLVIICYCDKHFANSCKSLYDND